MNKKEIEIINRKLIITINDIKHLEKRKGNLIKIIKDLKGKK